jgi:hypothetical protein
MEQWYSCRAVRVRSGAVTVHLVHNTLYAIVRNGTLDVPRAHC